MGIPFIGDAINAIGGWAKAKEERKSAVHTAKLKIEHANQDAENQLALSDAEWESIKAKSEPESWKDEYVTVVITSPFLMIMLGGVYLAFTGEDKFLIGVQTSIAYLVSMGVDMSGLMTTVVYAAVGLKAWRAVRG